MVGIAALRRCKSPCTAGAPEQSNGFDQHGDPQLMLLIQGSSCAPHCDATREIVTQPPNADYAQPLCWSLQPLSMPSGLAWAKARACTDLLSSGTVDVVQRPLRANSLRDHFPVTLGDCMIDFDFGLRSEGQAKCREKTLWDRARGK